MSSMDDDDDDLPPPDPVIGAWDYDDGPHLQIRYSHGLGCLDHVEKNCEMNGEECVEAYEWCMAKGLIAGAPLRLTADGETWMTEYYRDRRAWIKHPDGTWEEDPSQRRK